MAAAVGVLILHRHTMQLSVVNQWHCQITGGPLRESAPTQDDYEHCSSASFLSIVLSSNCGA